MTAPLTAWFDHGTGNGGDEARGARGAPPRFRGAARAPPTSRRNTPHRTRAAPPPGRVRAPPGRARAPARPPTTSRSSAGHWTRPARPRPGRRVPARTDGAGGAKKTIEPLTRRRASCSVGVHPARPHTADPRAPSPRPPGHPRTTPTATPGTGRTPPRPADPPDLTAWPQGMRANRAPRAAPPGWPAALRGHRRSHRPTALATNTKGGRLPGLEVRHRPRTRRQGTASAAQKTPGSTTSLRRASRRTASDARSWPRPADLPTFSQTPALADASAHAWEPIRFLHVGGDRTGGLRPRLGTQDDPPATDEHPRRHHPPHPPHRPPPQDRPPPEHLTARQPPAPPDPTGPIDSTTPAPRPPRSRKKNPGPQKDPTTPRRHATNHHTHPS